MPEANHDGVRIHYELAGDAGRPPLLLHHGFASSGDVWAQFGHVQGLAATHRLILIDARGHGRSDKPHERSAYGLAQRVGDVLAVLDALGIEQSDYFGYSMGGWVGWGVATRAPQRLRRLVIAGAHPYEDRSWAVFDGLDGSDPEAFIAALEAVIEERIVSPLVRERTLANDLRALVAAGQVRADLSAMLPGLALPCLLIVGSEDSRRAAMQRAARALPSARFVALPGLNHVTALVDSAAMLPHLHAFLDRAPGTG